MNPHLTSNMTAHNPLSSPRSALAHTYTYTCTHTHPPRKTVAHTGLSFLLISNLTSTRKFAVLFLSGFCICSLSLSLTFSHLLAHSLILSHTHWSSERRQWQGRWDGKGKEESCGSSVTMTGERVILYNARFTSLCLAFSSKYSDNEWFVFLSKMSFEVLPTKVMHNLLQLTLYFQPIHYTSVKFTNFVLHKKWINKKGHILYIKKNNISAKTAVIVGSYVNIAMF